MFQVEERGALTVDVKTEMSVLLAELKECRKLERLRNLKQGVLCVQGKGWGLWVGRSADPEVIWNLDGFDCVLK